jgi:dihydrolipoamide dehydrogenase
MEIRIPHIGDLAAVPVIEIHVTAGTEVAVDDPLVTLESDKATMDIPAPVAGTVMALRVSVGDRVSEGDVVADLTPSGFTQEQARPASDAEVKPAHSSSRPRRRTQLLVIGAGPGGYTAAFRAADLGLEVTLVDRSPTLGGVCLNVGCIPSKALLHASKVIAEAREMSTRGLEFGAPTVNLDALRNWKDSVVNRLTSGLKGLARQRKVAVVHGTGRFLSSHELEVSASDEERTTLEFDQAIIAVGSEPARLPFLPVHDPRVMDSTAALELADVPGRLLVIGGGIIGLEMAAVYDALGSHVTVVELMDQLIPGADRDVVAPLDKRIRQQYEGVYLDTSVQTLEPTAGGLRVTFEGPHAPSSGEYDAVLVSVGRRPAGRAVNASAAGVAIADDGFIHVDRQMRTNVQHIFAIGDVVGQPMLAHKAAHQGKVAAEVAAGQPRSFDARAIPSVAYTDPEVAWVGLTEAQASAAGRAYRTGVFPWAASGRALSLGRGEGFTKLLFDETSRHVIGAGIVGPSAGELVAEVAVGIEMGLDALDIGLTIHPHPTLSESLGMAAEAFEGTITDLHLPRPGRSSSLVSQTASVEG